MTPEQLQTFLEDNRKSTADAINLTVNGKLDVMRAENAKAWKRIEPVVIAYETSERALKDARASGRFILWIAGFITAVGSAYLIIKQIFFTR